MQHDVRFIRDEELAACERMKSEMFGIPWSDERLRDVRAVREVDRIVAVFDDTDVVATLAAGTFELTVPQGRVPAAGISGLAVRDAQSGLTRALFARQLDDAHRRGEPVACLCALSDSPTVYSAYGFAVASRGLDWRLTREDAMGLDLGQQLKVEPIPPHEFVANAQPVFAATARTTPGVASRSAGWWRRIAASATGEALSLRAVADGAVEGYALARPDGDALLVTELLATSPRGYLSLWAHLINDEGFAKVHAWHRSTDEPLQLAIHDPRVLRRRVADGIWLRLLDVPAAMRARSYAARVRLVMEVIDSFLPATGGRFLLDTAAGTCEPTRETADVELSVSALSATYLGGVSLFAPAAAGQVVERTPGALADLARALGPVGPQPWAVTRF